MRNRAKCKLCESVIESLGSHDYISCKCGHISVQGGKRIAGDWVNFISVHDDDSEHPVEVKDKEPIIELPKHKPTREELLNMLDAMLENIEKLPPHAMTQPITHYDLASLILLLSSILRSD